MLISPDSLWESVLWGSLLTGSALRGCRVLVIAPSFANAPGTGFLTITRTHVVLSRMLALSRAIEARIASAGGLLRIGLFNEQSAVGDFPGRAREMADNLDHYLRLCGARSASFPCIATVGDRGALPHAPPTSRRAGEGSQLLIDWGADLLYKSDITRTFRSPFAAPASRGNSFERTGYSLEQVHGAVLKAQGAALAAIRHGVAARAVDGAARQVLHDAGLGDFFTHGLGHGLDEAAIEAAKKIQFNPALQNGQPVDHTATLRVVFRVA